MKALCPGYKRVPPESLLNRAAEPRQNLVQNSGSREAVPGPLRSQGLSHLAQHLIPHKTKHGSVSEKEGLAPRVRTLGRSWPQPRTQHQELISKWVLPSKTHGQILSPVRSSPRGEAPHSASLQSASLPRILFCLPRSRRELQCPDLGSWLQRHCQPSWGKLNLAKLFTRFLPASPYGYLSRPFPSLFCLAPPPKVPPAWTLRRQPWQELRSWRWASSQEGLLSAHLTVLYHWEETKRRFPNLIIICSQLNTQRQIVVLKYYI